MKIIDLNKIREALPSNAVVTLVKENRGFKINCKIKNPTLSDRFPETFEKDFEQIKDWQRTLLGDAILEFYCYTTGEHWDIYLNRIPLQFTNL